MLQDISSETLARIQRGNELLFLGRQSQTDKDRSIRTCRANHGNEVGNYNARRYSNGGNRIPIRIDGTELVSFTSGRKKLDRTLTVSNSSTERQFYGIITYRTLEIYWKERDPLGRGLAHNSPAKLMFSSASSSSVSKSRAASPSDLIGYELTRIE